MPRVVDHQQRKAMIAGAACMAIARHGLDAVTLAHVGEAADCTTGTVTHYYTDKEQVLLAALDHAIETMNLRMEQRLRKNPGDAIGFFCETLPLGKKGRAEIRVWYSFWSRAMHDAGLARRQRAMHRRWRGKVEQMLGAMQERGEIRLTDAPREEAEAFCAMINGIGLRATLDPREWPAERQTGVLQEYLARLAP